MGRNRRCYQPGAVIIEVGHVTDIFFDRRNLLDQVDDQDPVFSPYLPDGLIEPVKSALKIRIGNPLADLQVVHHFFDQGVGVIRQAAYLGHENRGDAPGPANIYKGLQIQGKFPDEQVLVDSDFLAPDILEFITFAFPVGVEDAFDGPGQVRKVWRKSWPTVLKFGSLS